MYNSTSAAFLQSKSSYRPTSELKDTVSVFYRKNKKIANKMLANK